MSVHPFRQKTKAIPIFPWVFENPYPGRCNPSVKNESNFNISMSVWRSLPRPVQPFHQKMKAISIFPWVFENAYPGQCSPPSKSKSKFNISMCFWKCLPGPARQTTFVLELHEPSGTLRWCCCSSMRAGSDHLLETITTPQGPKQPWSQRGPIGVMGVIE